MIFRVIALLIFLLTKPLGRYIIDLILGLMTRVPDPCQNKRFFVLRSVFFSELEVCALPNWFVCVLGVGTVFVGLVCLVFICKLLSLICRKIGTGKESVVPAESGKSSAPASDQNVNMQETVAAIAAAIAEDLGSDVSAIRILSIKKI